MDGGKKTAVKIITAVVFIMIIAAATVAAIPLIRALASESGRLLIEERVRSLGVWGVLAFFLLQVLQIIIAIIPGEPVEILGGILFGWAGGTLLCLGGCLVGTAVVFFLVRKIGRPLTEAFVSQDKLEKLAFLQDEKKLETIVFLLFLIPGTPKDILTYFVPLTKIKPAGFFILSTLARIPSVASSVIVGSNIGGGNFLVGIIIFAATAAIGIFGIYFNEKLLSGLRKRRGEKRK